MKYEDLRVGMLVRLVDPWERNGYTKERYGVGLITRVRTRGRRKHAECHVRWGTTRVKRLPCYNGCLEVAEDLIPLTAGF